jgi:hypothetical protein
LYDADQRSWSRFSHTEPDKHLARLKPAIVIDCLLRHVSEHRVGATERDHRHLAKEQSDIAEYVVPAKCVYQRDDRTEPQDQADDRDFDGAGRRRSDVVGNFFGERPIDGCRLFGLTFRLTMPDRSAKSLEARGMPDKADKTRRPR